ncbi:hypothetical protein Hdeb2414_s0015g00438571 [Helianthus debilis subsp. tardiflorus]
MNGCSYSCICILNVIKYLKIRFGLEEVKKELAGSIEKGVCTLNRYGNASEIVIVDDNVGPVTSVKWALDGRHISVGLNNLEV